jgi:O-acetyl-ADP-ribose deacetylase (regulator of RNase III)
LAHLEVVRGDITTQELGGGGVDGAIHRAGGPEILAECRLLGGCETGDAKATTGGNLPARFVIHTVGPVWHGGARGEPELLAAAHRRSLDVARELGVRSVAFPAISCGLYGYPIDQAATIATAAAREHGHELELIRFVLFNDDVFAAFDAALRSP